MIKAANVRSEKIYKSVWYLYSLEGLLVAYVESAWQVHTGKTRCVPEVAEVRLGARKLFAALVLGIEPIEAATLSAHLL